MFKLFKKKVIEQEVQPSVKESVVNLKKDFKQFIKECDEHNKKMHELCLEQLCDNAYLCGKAGIEIDFTKDTYTRHYDNIEIMIMRTNWQQGNLELKMDRLGVSYR